MRHIVLGKDYVDRHKNLMIGMCEKQKRLYLGNLAIDLKYGGISAVAAYFQCWQKSSKLGRKGSP